MSAWTCEGCGCEYSYMESTIVNNQTYCTTCADDALAEPAKAGGLTAGHVFAFIFGIFCGILGTIRAFGI